VAPRSASIAKVHTTDLRTTYVGSECRDDGVRAPVGGGGVRYAEVVARGHHQCVSLCLACLLLLNTLVSLIAYLCEAECTFIVLEKAAGDGVDASYTDAAAIDRALATPSTDYDIARLRLLRRAR
jgi:hypothetical protein